MTWSAENWGTIADDERPFDEPLKVAVVRHSSCGRIASICINGRTLAREHGAAKAVLVSGDESWCEHASDDPNAWNGKGLPR